jgi:hypothetical protein
MAGLGRGLEEIEVAALIGLLDVAVESLMCGGVKLMR